VESEGPHRGDKLQWFPTSPLLHDAEWVGRFERIMRGCLFFSQELVRLHALPGYPLAQKASDLRCSLFLLNELINEVFADDKRRLQTAKSLEELSFEHTREIGDAYQWTVYLLRTDRFQLILTTRDTSTHPDLSWIPTQAEIESLQRILELIIAGKCRLSPPSPKWDRASRKLWYGETLCREYAKEARNQFAVLDAFEAAGWQRHVDSPFPGNHSRLLETIGDLNEKLSRESPIRFRGSIRPEWYLPSSPDNSG